MADALETLKLLADPTRLRIVNLLSHEELSVAELQSILDMGQSRISSHLALLRQGALVEDRKDGKHSYYAIAKDLPTGPAGVIKASLAAVTGHADFVTDRRHLERVLEKRRQVSEQYFNEVAGRLGKKYCPGRSWEAIGHLLLHLTPRIRIADLGAGEGVLSQLLAKRADEVFCIDNSPRMVEVGSRLAKENGIENLSYRLGDIEQVPLDDASVDLALLSQALHHARRPQNAIREAHRILKPGGQILILDLNQHTFEKARELYADVWLGFSPNAIYGWLKEAGFKQVTVDTVARESTDPAFETFLAAGVKA